MSIFRVENKPIRNKKSRRNQGPVPRSAEVFPDLLIPSAEGPTLIEGGFFGLIGDLDEFSVLLGEQCGKLIGAPACDVHIFPGGTFPSRGVEVEETSVGIFADRLQEARGNLLTAGKRGRKGIGFSDDKYSSLIFCEEKI